jgi:plasmid stabilization system protein ParE
VKVVFSEFAERELRHATAYYEQQLEGLGQQFRAEVRLAANRIATYPNAWSVERGDIRKCTLLKFPYKLLYSVEDGHVFIIAVAHQHREPEYWMDREQHK